MADDEHHAVVTIKHCFDTNRTQTNQEIRQWAHGVLVESTPSLLDWSPIKCGMPRISRLLATHLLLVKVQKCFPSFGQPSNKRVPEDAAPAFIHRVATAAGRILQAGARLFTFYPTVILLFTLIMTLAVAT